MEDEGGEDDEPRPLDAKRDQSGGDWLSRGEVDLVAHTVEAFRLQRLSMVQTLRQFVLCYESVLEWVAKAVREEALGFGKDPHV
jgi:protein-tyrosine phosphatase